LLVAGADGRAEAERAFAERQPPERLVQFINREPTLGKLERAACVVAS
jgi:hypothetical protein